MKSRITVYLLLLIVITLLTPLMLVGCGEDGGKAAGKVTKEAASAAGKTLRQWQQQR